MMVVKKTFWGPGMSTGVVVDGDTVPADSVVLAMGPWTGLARKWLPAVPPIFGQIGHSVVIKAKAPLSAHCLFVNHLSRSGRQMFYLHVH